MSLPEHCANHAPVPWAEMDPAERRARCREVSLRMARVSRRVRAAKARGDLDAAREHSARWSGLEAHWREIVDEGGGA